MAWLVPKHIPLPQNFVGFSPESGQPQPGFQHYTRHLPHWRKPGACYLCTFRLRDSLPAEIIARMKAEEKAWHERLQEAAAATATLDKRLSAEEWNAWLAFAQKQARKLDLLLDKGHGECLLRHAANRAPLVETLHHQEDQRVEMLAYAIMPNHVHVLCRPLPDHELETLTASWKRRSSQQIHQRLGRRGPLWQNESWDRIIRDAEHYATAIRYIAKNPLVARLNETEATVWLHPSITAQPAP